MNALGGVELVIAFGFWYALGLTRMWGRVGVGRLVSRTRLRMFVSGLVVTAVALGPPLDTHVDSNLPLHMTQHVLLMWIAAPLLIAGSPMPTLVWALPASWRMATQRRWRRVHRSVASSAWPAWVAGAVVLQAVTLAVWHIPRFYEAAISNGAIHVAEHASFLLSSMVLWWTVAGAVQRMRFGAGVLAVFVAKLPGLVLGVGMTLDAHIWYRSYGTDVAALHDQQLAGVIMWVGGGMIATVAALVLFWLWMQALERNAPNPPVAVPELAT